MPLLEIRDLTVEFATARGRFRAVEAADITVEQGEVLCIVGESGSGKSVSMLALMGLIPFPGRVTAQVMRFNGIDLLHLTPRQRRRVIGKDMAMVFQEPMSSLNPCYPIGWQIARIASYPPRGAAPGGARPRGRAAGAGGHSRCGEPAGRVSASAFRRHEPAGDDRHGDCLQSASC